MKTITYKIFCLLLVSIVFYSCEKWNLDEEIFLQIDLSPPETISIDSVTLSATLKDFTGGQIQSHGFLWTTLDQAPTFYLNSGLVDLQAKTKEDSDQTFSAAIELEPNETYLLRAFARLDGTEFVYSETISYVTGNAKVFSENIHYEDGFSLQATGRLSGMDKGFVALEHGFCWSTDNPEPTRDDQVVNLGENRSNLPFVADIGQLVNNVPYYIRPYAVIRKDSEVEVIYGTVMEFDGDLEFWEKANSFEVYSLFSGIGFSIGSKGYVGLGGFGAGSDSPLFWEYDPTLDEVTQKSDFIGSSTFGTGFSIGNKGYFCTSSNDFYEYDPALDEWIQKADFIGEPRFYAGGFSIGDKGYIGTGSAGTFETPIYFNDFYEYNPALDEWTQVADFIGESRQNASSFSIGDKGYIGTGRAGNWPEWNFFKDFYEYDPALDEWTQVADFGGAPRENASGFSIGDKGYLIWGTNRTTFCMTDFWSYNPDIDTWSKIVDFPAPPRHSAVAFSIDGIGYLGTGQCSITSLDDIWKYDP